MTNIRKKNVLFTKGIADDGKVKVASIREGHLVYSPGGSTNIYNNLSTDKFEKSIVALDTLRHHSVNLAKYDLIFNQISDPDTHKKVLRKLEFLLERSKKTVYCCNEPKKILKTSRDTVYSLLKDIPNLIIPKTVKLIPKTPQDVENAIVKNQFTFPVLFRQAGDHGGISTILINSLGEIATKMYPFALDGREYYLTQFVDYRQQDIYKKFRLLIVDGEVYLRHVIFSDHWMIHSRSREFMKNNLQYNDMEIEILETFDELVKPLIQQTIIKIHEILQLEYFGMDCHIDQDGKIILFELNANMNVLIDKNTRMEKYIQKIQNAIVQMLILKMEMQ